MKNFKLFALLPLLGAMMVACSPQKQPSTSTSTSTSQGGGGGFIDPDSSEPVLNQTYNFYIDFSHTDEPFFVKQWYTGKPLGEIPAECVLTSEDAPDPAFPIFLGWSEYPSTMDETKMWDFENTAKVALTVSLYGIWVSE